nr:hypothetical protein [Tanacetum cinerariifolium]
TFGKFPNIKAFELIKLILHGFNPTVIKHRFLDIFWFDCTHSRNTNPLVLVATAQENQDPYYQTSKSHKSYAPSLKPLIPTRSHKTTRSKGKEIAKPITPLFETASEEDSDPEQAQMDKDMQKNLALIAKMMNVDAARANVGSPVVQQSGIHCFNCKEFRHFAKECRKPKRVKDSAYHKEKMLLCKQAEKDLKAQMQDKNIPISKLNKLIEKGKGKSVETKFDKPSIVRQPNAQRIQKPSVLGKPAPFSDSLERRYFSKTKSVPKTNVSEGLSKLVTTQTLPQTARQAVSNTIVPKPEMYRIDNRTTQTTAPQSHQTVRNTNPRVSTSTGVNHKTNVSRPHHRSNQLKDKVVPNNSQVKPKKTQVEEHPRISSISNKTKSVTACSNLQDTQPKTNIRPTSAPSTPTYVHAKENNDHQAEEEHLTDDEFTNPFCIREAMVGSAWIEAIQEELYQFDRLQAKYALEKLHKHSMEKGQTIGTPMAMKPKLDVDLSGNPVDQTDYRSKIGSLMYLTSSRPDIV